MRTARGAGPQDRRGRPSSARQSVLDQYPDINDVLPVISVPVLWLAGDLDPITTGYDMATLFTRITSVDSEYQVASGDHKGMVANSEAPIINWLASLGL